MEVIINDHTVEIPSRSSLNDALSKAGVNDPKGIAVAVNNQVVPKTNWQSVSLNEHDEILVIQATQGG